jgi:hypothetical protein
MAYVSLYRKYRPQTFADVVGQEHVTRTLQNAIAAGRVATGICSRARAARQKQPSRASCPRRSTASAGRPPSHATPATPAKASRAATPLT